MMAEGEIMAWAMQDIFRLRPYILEHARPQGGYKGPLTRGELREAIREWCAENYANKWDILHLGAESALENRLDENDPWFAIGDDKVISYDDAVAETALAWGFKSLVPDIVAGRIAPPAELAEAARAAPYGAAGAVPRAVRRAPMPGSRSASRFGGRRR